VLDIVDAGALFASITNRINMHVTAAAQLPRGVLQQIWPYRC